MLVADPLEGNVIGQSKMHLLSQNTIGFSWTICLIISRGN